MKTFFQKYSEKIILNLIYIVVPFFIYYGVCLFLITFLGVNISDRMTIIFSAIATIYFHPTVTNYRKKIFNKDNKQNQ